MWLGIPKESPCNYIITPPDSSYLERGNLSVVLQEFNRMDVKSKVAIITGASAGIGQATARRFATEGAKLVLAARSTEKLVMLAEELYYHGHEALPVTTDMRDPVAVKHMIELAFEHYGRIDILINNAGQAAAGTVADMNLDDFRKILDLNVFGVLYAMQAAIPKMRHGGGGVIINVSSMVTKMHIPGLSAYSATKKALNMLTKTARIELAADNIRVITVYPRMTSTDFAMNSLGNQQLRQRQRAEVPANVVIDTPEHVAEKILEAAQKEPAEQFMDK
jgi:NADP-dependent 3-hydroxy acid dehydrogenase YdfG